RPRAPSPRAPRGAARRRRPPPRRGSRRSCPTCLRRDRMRGGPAEDVPRRRPRARRRQVAGSRSGRSRRRSTRPGSRHASAPRYSAGRSASQPGSPRRYRTAVSPRHVPASVTELARVGLFADLTGETLTKLADRMQREEVTPGTVLIREGEPGDRFFVLLSGVAGVSQTALGERRILKAGEFFGEVALAMHVPRTATVTAMTPCVVASCDEATFDELVRPLFADDGA